MTPILSLQHTNLPNVATLQTTYWAIFFINGEPIAAYSKVDRKAYLRNDLDTRPEVSQHLQGDLFGFSIPWEMADPAFFDTLLDTDRPLIDRKETTDA